MMILHGLDQATQRLLSRRLPPNVPDQVRTLALVHPLFIGADEAEREARIRKILEHLLPDQDAATIEDYARREEAQYLAGLQQTLDNPFYTVGILFESKDKMERIAKLEAMDKTGRPWLVVPTHVQGADPDPGRAATWQSTITDLVSLGVKHIDVGGCYLVVDDDGRIVPTSVYYSCVNNVIFQLTAPRPKPFQSVGVALTGTYIKPLPPPEYR